MNLLQKIARRFQAKNVQSVKTTSKSITVRKMSEQFQRSATSTFHDPKSQPFYGFKDGAWQTSNRNEISTYTTLPTIKLISWNIDFQASASLARITRALNYLQELIGSLPPDMPSIILLQEMTSSDLDIIQRAEWIRKDFRITEVSSINWQAHYGTIALVDRRLRVATVFRVNYASDMGRDALFVDVENVTPSTLRFCNTHLESLPVEPPLRPAQVRLAARYLKDPIADGGVIAGDFNAIQDFDRTLHTKSGLKDAYLENGGGEESENGWTWGMQSQRQVRQKFGCKRLDKVLYCGKAKVQNLERIGADVRTEGSWVGQYVTDHLGLMGDVVLEEES